jgi:hypothetical protein
MAEGELFYLGSSSPCRIYFVFNTDVRQLNSYLVGQFKIQITLSS